MNKLKCILKTEHNLISLSFKRNYKTFVYSTRLHVIL